MSDLDSTIINIVAVNSDEIETHQTNTDFTQHAESPGLSSGTVAVIAGVSCAGFIFLLVSIRIFIRKRRAALRTGISDVLPTDDSRPRRTARDQGSEVEDGLPTYESAQRDQIVTTLDVGFIPSHRGIVPNEGVPVALELQDISSLIQMQQKQEMVKELIRLALAAPSGGYRQDSLEMTRIIQLSRETAELMEAHQRSCPRPREPGAPEPYSYPPSPSTPQHRRQQIQQFLSQLDHIISTGDTSEETQSNMKDLCAQIAVRLADSSNEPIAGTSSSAAIRRAHSPLRNPEKAHAVSLKRQSGDSPQSTGGGSIPNEPGTVNNHDSPLARGRDGSQGRSNESSHPGGTQGEPPPYQVV